MSIDRHDSVIASGWLVIITDSSEIVKSKEIILPPIIAPEQSVARGRDMTFDVRIVSKGNLTYSFTAPELQHVTVTVFDLLGKQVANGKSTLEWRAPSSGQIYMVLIEGETSGKRVRRMEKLLVR
jgi:hypothetical protein